MSADSPVVPTAGSPGSGPGGAADDVVGEVRAAVGRYETALAANDLAALDAAFAPGPTTLRADADGVLASHEAISRFRRARAAAPDREVTRLDVVVHGPTVATAVAQTRRPDGSTGVRTQVWERGPQGWQIRVAHVSSGPVPVAAEAASPAPTGVTTAADARAVREDPATWRVLGSPLVPATGSGPLDGVSLAVKDLVSVAGHRVGAGNPVWLLQSEPEREHAPALRRLLDAGATVRGIARTDELAYSLSGTNVHYGSPPNPWGPGLVVGGSSNGPASAVARGLVQVGIGTDTGGSIRVPASHCGLHGLRPTHDVISVDGVLPLASSFDTLGWLVRDADLLDRVAGVMLPESPTPRPTELVLAEDLLGLAEPAVRDAIADAAAELAADAGIRLHRTALCLPGELDQWFTAFRTVQAAQAWAAHGNWITAHPGVLGPGIAQRFAAGAAVSSRGLTDARAMVSSARAQLADRVHPTSAVLLPAASSPAPAVSDSPDTKQAYRSATLRLTTVAGVGGLPVAVAPASLVRGLPVGLAVMGARGSDRMLTGLLRDWGRRQRPPSM